MLKIDTFTKSPFFQQLLLLVKAQKNIAIEELWDAPKALLITALTELNRPILIITGGDREGKLLEDLDYFLPNKTLSLPSWETLPGEDILPSPDIMGRRLDLLQKIEKDHAPIVMTSISSALQKLPSITSLKRGAKKWKIDDEVSFNEIEATLEELGFTKTKLVQDKGQFAIRGGIVDLFPPALLAPVRVEFFGETIEQIRSFDPMSQRSTESLTSVFLSVADEYALLSKGEPLSSLFEYMKDSIVIFDDLLALEDRYMSLKSLNAFNSSYFLPLEEILQNHQNQIYFSHQTLETLSEVQKKSKDTVSFSMFGKKLEAERLLAPFLTVESFINLKELKEELSHLIDQGFTVTYIVDNEPEKSKFIELLPKEQEGLVFKDGYLSSGLALEREKILLLPYTEITHRYKLRRSRYRSSYHTPISDFHNLETNDFVVHFHNGIGKYIGIETQTNHLGVKSEFLVIEYAEKSKLFVPISQSHLVSRYIGSHEELPSLHKLGTTKWHQAKVKAQQAIVGYAKDLLQLQANREVQGGFCFPEDGIETKQFADCFPYVETEDQIKAIKDVYSDMQSHVAMDRLVLGDVGYGKTEVAMRAAFKAVADGKKQVAILVPTTVLAMQHYENFKERMQAFPVNVGIISRFQTAKAIKETLDKLALGKLDIIVGTHRLLSKDVIFKDLGLMIIDEEQRFGVKAKESLKKLKVSVDALTMSATPIPRTLYMSLINLRPMSVINSPPQDRLPIKTIIAENDPELIKNALVRELSRDGQAYIIHNRVESIFERSEEIQKLVPTAKIAIAHGQLHSDILDRIFHEFKSGEVDILLATTIVENGVDIPNANTLIVDKAHHFGISSLYQLRGRVGRWNKSAFAYFLTPPMREIPEVAAKRMRALIESSGFGGAMKLAMIDLEIRGAGDILGTKQSGQLSNIGFHLYCKLLKRAIDALKNKSVASFNETRMEFTFDAKIPAYYIDDVSLRLEIYHRLGEASTFNEVESLTKEMIDRFGKLPEPVIWLKHMTRIKVFANQHNFTFIQFLSQTIVAEREEKTGKANKQSMFAPPRNDPESYEIAILKKLTQSFNLYSP